MPKKPTREQRERINARRRERYAEGRRLGLSPKEARAGYKVETARLLAEAERKRKEKEAAKKKKPKKRRKQRDETGAMPAPKRRVTPEHIEAFRRFVREHPDWSKRKLYREFTKETGLGAGHNWAPEVVREVREEDKNYDKMRFKRYTEENAPFRIHPPAKDRFYYVVRYQTERVGQPDPYEEHMTITSDVRLSALEIVRRVYEYFYKAQEAGLERYILKRIIPDSIVILYEIDLGPNWRHRNRKAG